MTGNYVHTAEVDNFVLPTGVVTVTPDKITTTVPGGAQAYAVPTYKEVDHDRAENLGYPSPYEMHRDHDLTHCLLAHWLGLPASPVIAGVARQTPLSKAEAGAEEEAVLAVQKFAQQQGVDLRRLALALAER